MKLDQQNAFSAETTSESVQVATLMRFMTLSENSILRLRMNSKYILILTCNKTLQNNNSHTVGKLKRYKLSLRNIKNVLAGMLTGCATTGTLTDVVNGPRLEIPKGIKPDTIMHMGVSSIESTPIGVVGIDSNKNGVEDERYVYSIRGVGPGVFRLGELILYMRDLNKDGKYSDNEILIHKVGAKEHCQS